ncbi:MAG TPA: OmpA family protein [Candidatus Acidoferrales bacterium]|nr:OmpA family protein [Candidatus Acidoferrales bacterium]
MKRLGLRLHADEEHWIPLADLMTGLMLLFLLIALAYMVQVERQQSRPKNALALYEQKRTLLAHDLDSEFRPDFAKWGAEFDPKSLSIRFRARDVLFAPGSSELQPRFKTILDDFFPRYLRILNEEQYRNIVSEVRIEGYTSSFWRSGASVDESYVANMALSQDRARSVLGYVLQLPPVAPQKAWLMQVLTANGLSSSHLVRRPDGTEDADASQRVEFSVRTNADAQVRNVLALAATSPPLPNVPVVTDPMPAFPAWSAPLIGHALRSAFPTSTQCLGFFDGAMLQYEGARPGVKLYGWAYDDAAQAPVDRVIFTDANGTIVGAGDGGFERADVPATLAAVTSPTTGWQGYAGATTSPLAVWAIPRAARSVCRLAPSKTAAGGP